MFMNGNALPKVIKMVRPLEKTAGVSSLDSDSVRENIRQNLEISCRLLCDSTLSQEIQVTCEVGKQTCVFFIDCPQPALGKILGSGGKNINALRTLVTAMSACAGFRAVVEVAYHDAR
jgi:predicted RNA-binding protein YlqC (UPF0109 family)